MAGAVKIPVRRKWYHPISLSVHVFAILLTVLFGVWIHDYLGGYSSDIDSYLYPNAHIIYASIAVFLLGTEGAFAFKVLPGSKDVLKWVHAILNIAAFVCYFLAIRVAYNYNAYYGYSQFYSGHAFLGLTVAALWALQIVIGVVFLVYPICTGWSMWIRSNHAFLGIGTLALAFVTGCMGLIEEQHYVVCADDAYCAETMFANVIFLVIAVGGVVVWFNFQKIKAVKGESTLV